MIGNKWYHATTDEKWKQIQAEGFLWSIRNASSRCTYLARNKDDAKKYGLILLEVLFDPLINIPNNYVDGCWQCRIYSPISLDNVTIIDE